MKQFVTIMLLGSAALYAADESGFVYWPSGELKGYEKKLAAKVGATKVATEQLNNFGNHLTMVAHREGAGEAELHEKMADFFVVQSGEATLVYGGTVDQGKTTTPGEIRGPSIKSGAKKKLATGDMVHIPAGMPHQLLVDNGKQFTYFVIKVSK